MVRATGWRCGKPWDECERRCLNAPRWRSLKICLNQSLLCPRRPMLGRSPARWSAKQRNPHQKINKIIILPSVLALLFFPRPLFPSTPTPESFVLSPSSLPTFFSSRLSRLVFSHLPSPPLAVVSRSACPPPPPPSPGGPDVAEEI